MRPHPLNPHWSLLATLFFKVVSVPAHWLDECLRQNLPRRHCCCLSHFHLHIAETGKIKSFMFHNISIWLSVFRFLQIITPRVLDLVRIEGSRVLTVWGFWSTFRVFQRLPNQEVFGIIPVWEFWNRFWSRALEDVPFKGFWNAYWSIISRQPPDYEVLEDFLVKVFSNTSWSRGSTVEHLKPSTLRTFPDQEVLEHMGADGVALLNLASK